MKDNPPIRQSPLCGRKIRLEPMRSQEHADIAYHAVCQTAEERPYLFQGHTPDKDTVVRGLAHDSCHVKFAIVSVNTLKPVGYCYCYELDTRDRYAKVGLYLLPNSDLLLAGIEAVNLLLNYLYVNWDLHKIYAYTEHFPYQRLEPALGGFFKQEGHLRAHYAYQHRTWDEDIFAFYRTDLAAFNKHVSGLTSTEQNIEASLVAGYWTVRL